MVADENGFDAQCIDDRGDGECQGMVEMWSTDGLKSWPRCDKHGMARLKRYEESELEKYANSDVPPPGFDPSYAGERWDEDY